jgi:hypothetical protein
MNMPAERVPDPMASAFEDDFMDATAPMDERESADLHRAINERRAQLENPELLRRLRSL